MAAITWTDALGTATLRPRRPTGVSRFAAWVPVQGGPADRATALGTGVVTAFVYRVDYGATCTLAGISAHPHPGCLPAGVSPLSLAVRLAWHLNNGGQVTVDPEVPGGPAYVCTVLPGMTIGAPQMTDATKLEYSQDYGFRSVTNAPMPHPYAVAFAAV